MTRGRRSCARHIEPAHERERAYWAWRSGPHLTQPAERLVGLIQANAGRTTNARLAVGNEGAGGSIGGREFGRSACRVPRGRMRLYEKCEEDEHNCGAQTREEDRPLNLTQIEHGYSRTSKYQRTMAAQNGTPNASQAPRSRLIRSAEHAI